MDENYSGQSILIVDNKLEDLGVLRSILSSAGFGQIQVASSVNMALNLMRLEPCDICLAEYDLGKHEKNGLQLLHEANAEGLRRGGDTFILIVDPARSNLLFGSLEHSPDTYISKPYDLARVRHRLEKILRVKQVTRSLEALLDAGELDAFLQRSEQLIQRFPGLRVFLARQQGIVLLRLGRYRDAIKLFNRLLRNRDMPWAEVGLGLAQAQAGLYREALATLNRVVDQQHICVEAYYWLGRVHWALGELNQAVTLMRKAVMLQPTVPSLQGELGDLAAQAEQLDIALDAYRQAVKFARGTVFQQPGHYLGLVRILGRRINGADPEQARLAENEVVRVLENALLDHAGEEVVQLQVKLCAYELYQGGRLQARADQVWRDLNAAFARLDEEERCSWIDRLVALAAGRAANELVEEQRRLRKVMMRFRWGKAVLAASVNQRRAEYGKAFALLRQASELRPEHLLLGLETAEAGLEFARIEKARARPVLLHCLRVLSDYRVGELTQAEARRYRHLVAQCTQAWQALSVADTALD